MSRPYPQTHRIITLDTPEGVQITFDRAALSERWLAFLTDFFIIICIVAGTSLFIGMFGISGKIIILLTYFFARNGYFAFFEYILSGATPGKRWRRLRVVDERGTPLSLESVIIRNISRETEVMLPLTVFFAPDYFIPNAPSWIRFIAFLWPSVFIGVIFLNKSRRRFGDFLAGTHVVHTPHIELLDDLAESDHSTSTHETYSFKDSQLKLYGEYELETLDELLRRQSNNPHTSEIHYLVAQKIIAKIKWEGEVSDTTAFLLAFYRAQREFLEKKMRYGKRKKDKNAPS